MRDARIRTYQILQGDEKQANATYADEERLLSRVLFSLQSCIRLCLPAPSCPRHGSCSPRTAPGPWSFRRHAS